MSQPKSILEQILEEQREIRKQQEAISFQQSTIVELLRMQAKVLAHIAEEEEEVEHEVEEIEQDLQPMAMSMTYDLSAVPFQAKGR